MPRQLDLVTRPGLRVTPKPNRAEPTLWVRRLVIWSEPGIVLRDITLRPGLNIVWSPDPADRGTADDATGALGHGSGKTLFCRLLRYCLGEDRFATDAQRDRIALALKEGMVGAEVIVDGTSWSIVRPLGLGRTTAAVPNGNLDELAASKVDATGMAPFLEAVQGAVLPEEVAALVPGGSDHRAWLVALAWLTRDQECRFGSVLDWRSTASESGSPARGLSTTKTLDALRALVGAIAPEEHALRLEVDELQRARTAAEREAAHRQWDAARKRTWLAKALSLDQDDVPPGDLAVEVFKKTAREQLARVAQVDPSTDVADLEALRTEYDHARTRVEALTKEVAEADARMPEIERLVTHIKGELPGLSFSALEAQQPICPVCEVPIDRALAKGCKLSHKLPDLDEVRRRREQLQRDLDEETKRLATSKTNRARAADELATATQQADALRQRLRAAERAREDRRDAWYTARRLIDDADGFGELLHARNAATAEAHRLDSVIEAKREQAAAFRDERARVFRRISAAFDAIVRDLAGEEASGRIALDGNGLHLTVELGGERSTAAIDSLKVLAFDLAVLCVSIEGSTHLPAFLVHDSPREADLGLSAYHRLFRLARALEDVGEDPLFQYIVTTTTRPPAELNTEPWLRLTLKGAPADRRLLRKNL